MATLTYVTGRDAATGYVRVGHNSSGTNNDAVWSFSLSQTGASKITSVTFTLKWNNTSAGTGWSGSYSYTFAVSTSGSSGTTAYSGTHLGKKAVTLSGASGTATVTISGLSLTPGTKYYLRANFSGTTKSTMKAFQKASNTAVVANYTKLTYTVSYNANGGSGAPSSQTKTYGSNLTLSSTKPTRANASAGSYTVTFNANGGSCSTSSLAAARTTKYTFSSWNTNSSGTGTNYAAGGTYSANASVTLYAKWSSSTSTAAITLPTASRTGYTFKGWATSSTATSGSTGSYTPTKNITLYAVWQVNSYTLTVSNGSPDAITGVSGGGSKSYGSTVTVSATMASVPGYSVVFTKWTSSNVSLLADSANQSYTFNMPAGAVTLTATGTKTPNTYTVNFNAAGGHTTTLAKQVTYAATYGTLPTPTRPAYKFIGWFTSATGGTQITESSIVAITAEQVLYAHWEVNGAVRVYLNNEYKMALPHVYINGRYKQCVPHVRSGGNWRIGV